VYTSLKGSDPTPGLAKLPIATQLERFQHATASSAAVMVRSPFGDGSRVMDQAEPFHAAAAGKEVEE
jgi:hypothetical protein